MYDFLLKHGQKVSFGVGVFIALVFVAIAASGVSGMPDASTEELAQTSIFDFGLYSTYFLVAVCFLVAALFPLYYAVQNPKSAITGLIGLGVLLVVFGIAYAMSDGGVTPAMKEFNVGPGTGKFISASITTTIILAVGAIVAMFAGEIRTLFK